MTTPTSAVAGNAAEAQREEAKRPQGGGLFSRKYGPLPGWAWAGIAAGGALAWFWWRNRQASQASDTSSDDTADSGQEQANTDQIASLQDEIDALQGVVATETTTGTGGGSTTPSGGGSTTPSSTTKWVTANGKEDIYQIAKKNGLTESKFLSLNKTQKNLQKYVGTGKPLPKGWRVRVS